MNARLQFHPLGQAVGSLLRERREGLHISQKDLAELAGLSVHTISDVESGNGNPTLEVMGKLGECLGLEVVLRPRAVTLEDER